MFRSSTQNYKFILSDKVLHLFWTVLTHVLKSFYVDKFCKAITILEDVYSGFVERKPYPVSIFFQIAFFFSLY